MYVCMYIYIYIYIYYDVKLFRGSWEAWGSGADSLFVLLFYKDLTTKHD